MRCAFVLAAMLAIQLPAADLPTGVRRISGTDAESGISYTLLSIDGRIAGETPQPMPAPRLTAQCTRTSEGKLKFELLADLGGVHAISYYPPWKAKSSADFPPRLEKTQVTMEFFGYTQVKPVKRQWEHLEQIPDEMRYATPGLNSANMESISFYMQYLKALPTLRLTVPGKGSAEWETSPWRRAVHAEPMCSSAGI